MNQDRSSLLPISHSAESILSIYYGGGVSGEKEFLIDLIQPFIDKEDYARDYKKRSEIVTALCGNDAGIIGAAFA